MMDTSATAAVAPKETAAEADAALNDGHTGQPSIDETQDAAEADAALNDGHPFTNASSWTRL